MKCIVLLFLIFFSLFSSAQNNVLVLQNKKSNRLIEIKENKRIKLETIEGLQLYGRFTVVDSSSIMIDEQLILLEDVVKMRRKSLFGTIANPIFIVYGSFVIIAGIATIGTGGFGPLIGGTLIITGTPVFLVPLLSNKHPVVDWTYSIKSE